MEETPPRKKNAIKKSLSKKREKICVEEKKWRKKNAGVTKRNRNNGMQVRQTTIVIVPARNFLKLRHQTMSTVTGSRTIIPINQYYTPPLLLPRCLHLTMSLGQEEDNPFIFPVNSPRLETFSLQHKERRGLLHRPGQIIRSHVWFKSNEGSYDRLAPRKTSPGTVFVRAPGLTRGEPLSLRLNVKSEPKCLQRRH